MTIEMQASAGHVKPAGAFHTYAEPLIHGGYSPLPIVPGEKRPAVKAWSNRCTTPLTLEETRAYAARWPLAGLGVALGFNGVIAIDVDTEVAAHIAAICAVVPPSPAAKAGAKGWTSFYRAPDGASLSVRHYTDAQGRGILDLLGAGAQTVIPPSRHPAGRAYRWLTPETLFTVPAVELPELPPDIAARLDEALAPWRQHREFRPGTACQSPPEGFERRRLTAFARAALTRRARELAGVAEGGRNTALFALGAGLGRYVFHGLLAAGALESAAIAACGANGLLREDGRLAVLATLHKGLARAEHDPLPVLKERRVA